MQQKKGYKEWRASEPLLLVRAYRVDSIYNRIDCFCSIEKCKELTSYEKYGKERISNGGLSRTILRNTQPVNYDSNFFQDMKF